MIKTEVTVCRQKPENATAATISSTDTYIAYLSVKMHLNISNRENLSDLF